MLAEANFNNESSTECSFPPHQETQMERQTICRPFLQPIRAAKHLQSQNWDRILQMAPPNGLGSLKGLHFSSVGECWKGNHSHAHRMFNGGGGKNIRDSQYRPQ